LYNQDDNIEQTALTAIIDFGNIFHFGFEPFLRGTNSTFSVNMEPSGNQAIPLNGNSINNGFQRFFTLLEA
jgi:hypothetical protein